MDGAVELEICGNCKKEIPQCNYVMHSAHCARNFSLCTTCKEPIARAEFEKHRASCKPVKKSTIATSVVQKTKLEQSEYFSNEKVVQEKKFAERKAKRLEKLERYVNVGNTLGKQEPTKINEPQSQPVHIPVPKAPVPVMTNGAAKNSHLIPCQYCELELPKLDLLEHEDYCGSRTEKCEQCGEHVLFRDRYSHKDSRHGNEKLNARYKPPSPQLPRIPVFSDEVSSRYSRRNSNGSTEKLETSKEIARRLDCKTEYIRNLLQDSASITIPLRSTGTIPRLYRNNSGEGRPPLSPLRRPNPPTELVIPCEFCNIPIPHDDLIQHESGCRPDLARFNPRRRASSPSYYGEPEPSSPDVELPCEFCSDLIPASQLLSHQATCT